MKVIQTYELEGVLLLEPNVFKDSRGYFFESYNRSTFEDLGIKGEFVQDNRSYSTKGTLRGLHFQRGEMAQAKLVTVSSGEVFDVAVDLRKDSPTFGKWVGALLTEENKHVIYIPRGFAHGFVVLSETAEFTYKCDNFYSKEHEYGIHYNDPELAIDWGCPLENLLLSDKDQNLPSLKTYRETVGGE